MEESCFGFLIAGGLCSKLGRSLCERIKLTFATAQGCLHSLSLGRHDRFGRLCNQFLPKTLRFSLQRHKSSRIRLTPNSGTVCRFPAFASGNSCFISSPVQKLKNSAKQNSWRVCRFSPWNLARCFRIWLGVFGKAGFFRCQSTPGPPMPCFPYLMPAF